MRPLDDPQQLVEIDRLEEVFRDTQDFCLGLFFIIAAHEANREVRMGFICPDHAEQFHPVHVRNSKQTGEGGAIARVAVHDKDHADSVP